MIAVVRRKAVKQLTVCLCTGIGGFAVVAPGGLCAVGGTGGVMIAVVCRKAVRQLAVLFCADIDRVTVVAPGGLCAVGGAGGVMIAVVRRKTVRQLAVLFCAGLGGFAVFAFGSFRAVLPAGSIAITAVFAIGVGQPAAFLHLGIFLTAGATIDMYRILCAGGRDLLRSITVGMGFLRRVYRKKHSFRLYGIALCVRNNTVHFVSARTLRVVHCPGLGSFHIGLGLLVPHIPLIG